MTGQSLRTFCTGDDDPCRPGVFLAPLHSCRFKINSGLHQLKGAAAVGIMGRAITVEPMLKDLFDNFLLFLDRGDDKEATNPEGATGASNIVQIQIGHRAGNNLIATVEHRVVDQRDCETT